MISQEKKLNTYINTVGISQNTLEIYSLSRVFFFVFNNQGLA